MLEFNKWNTNPSSSNIAMHPHLFSDETLQHGAFAGDCLSELLEPAALVGHGHCESQQPAARAEPSLDHARQPTTIDVTAAYYAYSTENI